MVNLIRQISDWAARHPPPVTPETGRILQKVPAPTWDRRPSGTAHYGATGDISLACGRSIGRKALSLADSRAARRFEKIAWSTMLRHHPLRLVRLFVLILTTTIPLAACAYRVLSVEEVDKLIRDEVPAGSDKQRIKEFIDGLKFDSLRIDREEFHDATRQALGNRDPQKVAELGDGIAEFTGVVIYDTEGSFLNYNNIVIQFYVDKGGDE